MSCHGHGIFSYNVSPLFEWRDERWWCYKQTSNSQVLFFLVDIYPCPTTTSTPFLDPFLRSGTTCRGVFDLVNLFQNKKIKKDLYQTQRHTRTQTEFILLFVCLFPIQNLFLYARKKKKIVTFKKKTFKTIIFVLFVSVSLFVHRPNRQESEPERARARERVREDKQ
jgi:hypothetical protein